MNWYVGQVESADSEGKYNYINATRMLHERRHHIVLMKWIEII